MLFVNEGESPRVQSCGYKIRATICVYLLQMSPAYCSCRKTCWKKIALGKKICSRLVVVRPPKTSCIQCCSVMCGKRLIALLETGASSKALSVLFLFVSKNIGAPFTHSPWKKRDRACSLLSLRVYSDFTGNLEAFTLTVVEWRIFILMTA